MEILSNKLKMRDMNTQFINNDCVNNTPQIINSNEIPSKNNATLASDGENINAGEDNCNGGDININNYYYYNINNYYYYKLFLPHNSLKASHQNIQVLKQKTNELLHSLHSDLPHIICTREHHLNQLELDNISIENLSWEIAIVENIF